MNKTDVYRKHATEAEARAKAASDPELKRGFEDIAKEWRDLAEAAERHAPRIS